MADLGRLREYYGRRETRDAESLPGYVRREGRPMRDTEGMSASIVIEETIEELCFG